MSDERKRAAQPEDLARFFVERASAGDAGGLAALYEPDAILATLQGEIVGREAIRAAYERMFAQRPQVALEAQLPTLRLGDLALTASRLPNGGVTAEVARLQPDGTWLWILDRPTFRA